MSFVKKLFLFTALVTPLVSSCASNPAEQFVYDTASDYAYDLTKGALNHIDTGVTNAVEDKLVELSQPPKAAVPEPKLAKEQDSEPTAKTPTPPKTERQLIHERLQNIEVALFELNNRFKEAVDVGNQMNNTAMKFAELTEQELVDSIDHASNKVLANVKAQSAEFVDLASNQVLLNVRYQSILLVDELIALIIERMPTAIENINQLIVSVIAVLGALLLFLFTVPFILGWYLAQKTKKSTE